MAWVWLVLAGLLEVVWAVGLKYSEGFTRLVPSVITAVAAAASFWLLAVALKHIPLRHDARQLAMWSTNTLKPIN